VQLGLDADAVEAWSLEIPHAITLIREKELAVPREAWSREMTSYWQR
jgi:hypothetical protein